MRKVRRQEAVVVRLTDEQIERLDHLIEWAKGAGLNMTTDDCIDLVFWIGILMLGNFESHGLADSETDAF